jgi:hypothetical protein
MSPPPRRMAEPAAGRPKDAGGLGGAGLGGGHHRLHGVLAQHAGAPHTIKLGPALDDDEFVNETAGEDDFGVGQARAQIVVLVDR